VFGWVLVYKKIKKEGVMMKKILKSTVLIVLAAAMLFMFGCGVKNEQAAKDTAAKTDSVTEERKADLESAQPNTVEDKAMDVSKEALLKELSSMEKDWSADLHKIIIKSDGLLDKWIDGELSYNQYIMEFHKYKLEFDEFYNNAEAVYKEKDFANLLKDEPLYKNKLIQGKQLRDTVKDFFDIVYGGKKDVSGKIYDISGDRYKDLYNDKMVKQYNSYYRMLRQL
jgi:predicted outer membrane protein